MPAPIETRKATTIATQKFEYQLIPPWFRKLSGEVMKPATYAPIAKKAAYPRSNSPAYPTTMFSPSASIM